MEKAKEEKSKKAYELGFRYEKEYGGCSQCAIAALQESLGIKNEAVFKAGTGFAGGLGVTGVGTCGALIGAVMVISSKVGREKSNWKDPERIRWKTYDLAEKLYSKFVEEYGTSVCSEIQKKVLGRSYNLRDPIEYEQFEKAGGRSEKCPSVVGNAVKWAVETLLDTGL